MHYNKFSLELIALPQPVGELDRGNRKCNLINNGDELIDGKVLTIAPVALRLLLKPHKRYFDESCKIKVLPKNNLRK